MSRTIACLSKSHRANHLFGALQRLAPQYRNLGSVDVPKEALLLGALSSLSFDTRMIRLDARRSPAASQSLAKLCQERLTTMDAPPDAVLYWGATNFPGEPPLRPYYIITDGPYDPTDPSYPVEWIPRRWPKGYFELQRKIFREAQHVFTLSEWARSKVMGLHGLDAGRVTRIGWGPIGSIGGPMIHLPAGKRYVLSVGHEWARKGMDLVAEAGARLHAEDPDVVTVLVGQPEGCDIPEQPGVVQVRHGLPVNVVHQLMRTASAFVMASRFDASPHVLFEALQYGTPVVGSRVCGIPEVIDDRNGALCDVDADSIFDALQRVLSKPPAATRQAAFDSYVESGGWDGCARLIHGVIGS